MMRLFLRYQVFKFRVIVGINLGFLIFKVKKAEAVCVC